MTRLLIGAVFVLAGLIVAVVSYFGAMWDRAGTPPNWWAYGAAVVAVVIGIAILWPR